MANDVGDHARVFRNGTYLVLGWFCVLFGCGMAGGWLVYADDRLAATPCMAGALIFAVVGYVWFVRPRIHADADGVTVVNPLRTWRLRWAQVDRFEVKDVKASQGAYGVPGVLPSMLLRDGRGPLLCVLLRDGTSIAVWAVQKANIAIMLGRRAHADNVRADLQKMRARYARRPR